MSRVYREFDPNDVLDKLRTKTVALTDYQMVRDNLARVVIAKTGDWTKDEFLQQVTSMFNSLAIPVRDSFKELAGSNTVVGFVYSTPDIRTFETEDEGKYRALASNILMDTEDRTTWELKEGASGKYLCRHGMEDLSELAQGICTRRGNSPRLSSIAISAGVAPQEFVAWVDSDEGEVSYGYAVERDEDSGKLSVLSSTTNEVKEISEDLVVHAVHLNGEDQKMANMTLAANSDKGNMTEYYKKLFSYAPEYVAEIIKMINQHSFA
jgi:hypothetical protein